MSHRCVSLATPAPLHREKGTHNQQKVNYPFHQELQSGHDNILINPDYLGLYNLVTFPIIFRLQIFAKVKASCHLLIAQCP